ncbi:amidohydrolase family protein [Flavobacterium sp. HSC-61S13]|uniref:metal-dependent hydrolase family protein n=1 Tax=Flavobacterium sp. HSC-61S13 TaxID=2910963 RepID=UPI00209D15D0|nr:amidohydrolase family protein [Flavobacterium sp. HSC-61S13]MCP1996469.1 imidazolonepropionase-like amidohydrolase [Flavobacterium sp. HSC-61S13]
MKSKIFCLAVLSFVINVNGYGQSKQPTKVLIQNVQIFNGLDNKTTQGNVLIEGNLIAKISTTSIPTANDQTIKVIDGKGKFLMPGLIDAHVHLMFESVPKLQAMTADFAMLNFIAAKASEKQLLRGFTTVRDLGGGSLSLAKAIDMGLAVGPRVYSSGAFISQTGGHGDFGLPTDVPRKIGELSYAERSGIVAVADGQDAVLMRTREQLRQGATQIKLMAGGGVASDYDPLDVTQYTDAEFKAAVVAAQNWGTYVTVHAYTPNAIKTAINAGVTCIDHGQLADEETAKLMAQKGIWWSLQPFLDDEDANPLPAGSPNRLKQIEMSKGTDDAYALAKKYKIKTAWGTDVLFDSESAKKQGKKLAKLSRWYTPFEILKMATSTNAELLGMSGKRNPYQKGKLGEITEGAYADLILVDGNPLENIDLVSDPENNFLVIMKDGVVYKNTLTR